MRFHGKSAIQGIAAAFFVAGSIAFALTSPAAQAAEKTKLVFSSTPSSTAYYLWTALHMREISKNSDLDITVQESGGTEESLLRVQAGSAELGVVDSVVAQQRWGRDHNVRFLANGNPAVWQIFVAADSGIKTLRDLDGKNFSSGSTGAGSTKMTRAILDKLGIHPIEFEGTLDDAIDAFVDGRIVGLSFRGNGTNATGGLVEANASRPIRLIPFTEEEIKVSQQLYPFLSATKIQANVYPDQPDPIPSLSTWQTQIAANKDLPDGIVYEFLQKYFDAIPEVAKSQPAVGLVTLENSAEQSIIPMHSGAVKFYRDKGMTVPEAALPPEMK